MRFTRDTIEHAELYERRARKSESVYTFIK